MQYRSKKQVFFFNNSLLFLSVLFLQETVLGSVFDLNAIMDEFTFKITYSLQTHLSAYLGGSYMITQKTLTAWIDHISKFLVQILTVLHCAQRIPVTSCIFSATNTYAGAHFGYIIVTHAIIPHTHGHAANLPLALELIKKHDS